MPIRILVYVLQTYIDPWETWGGVDNILKIEKIYI